MVESSSANELIIYPVSESAVSIEFGNVIDESIVNRIGNFNRVLRQKPFPGLYDTVPAYTTLTIFFNPIEVIRQKDLRGKSCYEKVCGYLQAIESEVDERQIPDAAIITIPVCYGGSLGPDIDYVADFHHLGTDDVISLHSSAIYKVYMIGFIPGFAYMGGLSERLETPRRAIPRNKVPGGAVGIAGKQTGIYPLETPGGWQIIGQTPVKMFDENRQPPALLKAGDMIKFEPISLPEFKKYNAV